MVIAEFFVTVKKEERENNKVISKNENKFVL